MKIIDYCLKTKIKIIYAGSSTKYADEGPEHSPYSFTKYINTEIIKNSARWFDLKYSICYFYNNYGPRQSTCNDGWETVKRDLLTNVGTNSIPVIYVDEVEDKLNYWAAHHSSRRPRRDRGRLARAWELEIDRD